MSFSVNLGTCSLCGGPVIIHTQFSQFYDRESYYECMTPRCGCCFAVGAKPEKGVANYGPIIQTRKMSHEELLSEIREAVKKESEEVINDD